MITEGVSVSPAVLAFVITLLSSAVVATIVAQVSENKRYLVEKRIQRYEAFLKKSHKVHRLLKKRWGQIKETPLKQDDFWDFSENLNDLGLVASRKVITRATTLNDTIHRYSWLLYRTNEAMTKWDDEKEFDEFRRANRTLMKMDMEFSAQVEQVAHAMRSDVQGSYYDGIWQMTKALKLPGYATISVKGKRGESSFWRSKF